MKDKTIWRVEKKNLWLHNSLNSIPGPQQSSRKVIMEIREWEMLALRTQFPKVFPSFPSYHNCEHRFHIRDQVDLQQYYSSIASK